jgi:predicted anti-sigma-YlaC factor YlaD
MSSVTAYAAETGCSRARRTLSLVLDREAEVADIEALAAHLGRCARCRRFTAEVSAFTRHLRSAGLPNGPADKRTVPRAERRRR